MLVSDNGSTVSCLVDVLKEMGLVSLKEKTWDLLGNKGDLNGEVPDNNAGYSVSLSADGKTVAVGAPLPAADHGKGRVRVFSYTNAKWVQVGSDMVGKADGDQAGYSVSLSADGSTVAVGEVGFDGFKGRVRVFSYNNNTQSKWEQVGTNVGIVGETAGHNAGHSVSLSADGKTVAVGSPGRVGMGIDNDKGRVRMFSYNDTRWVPVGGLDDIVGEAGDQAGFSVSMSADGKTVAVGSPGRVGIGKGRVRVFSYTNAKWVQVGSDMVGEASKDQAGYSVSLSADGSTVAVGAIGHDSDRGRVRVFEL